MVIKQNCISPQYLRKDDIYVSILEIKNPAHFIVKESPDIKMSSYAKKFIEAEEMMQKYYHSIEAEFFQLPLKDSIVVVLHKKKFYRAQVRSILNVAEGYLIKVYLLDYGQECNISRQCLFEIHQDFLSHPFQAIDLKLLDMEPISLVMDSSDLTFDYGPVSTWDVSATAFIEDLQKVMNSAHIKIKGVGENFVFGSLHLTFDDQGEKCINEQLVLKKFARQTEDFWKGVTAIDVILSKVDPHHTIQDPGTASEDETMPNLKNSPKLVSSEKPEAIPAAVSPTVTALSPSSQSKPKTPITSLQKLKMLKKKSPVAPSNTTPVSSHVNNKTINVPSPTQVSLCEATENPMLDQNKAKPEGSKSLNGTPNSVKTSSIDKLQKLKNLKKALPSTHKAPDSSTPLTNQTTSETSSASLESPVVQTAHGRFPSSVIDGISPITGIKSEALSPGSYLSAVKDETNSLDTAFRDSIQPKDERKLSEMSNNEIENSNNNKSNSPSISSAMKYQNLKNLYKKRNSLPANPQTKPDESKSPNLKPSTLSTKGSDSDVSLSRFEDCLNEGFSDLDDTGDLLQCILDPKNNTAIDSSVMSSPDSRYVKK